MLVDLKTLLYFICTVCFLNLFNRTAGIDTASQNQKKMKQPDVIFFDGMAKAILTFLQPFTVLRALCCHFSV